MLAKWDKSWGKNYFLGGLGGGRKAGESKNTYRIYFGEDFELISAVNELPFH